MGTYREQLLKERGEIREAEEPSRFLAIFKIRFFICLILFGVFSYLWTTGQSVGQISAEDILELDHSSMGGEDSSYFFTEVPGCYAFLYNSIPSDDGKEYPHHNGRFCIDDSVLYLASAVFAQAVADQICK